MPKPRLHHTLLGFDFGMKRIGIAVGQTITHSAQALTIIKAQDGIPDWSQIKELIDEWEADGLIVGLPLKLDGEDQWITQNARKFARRLDAQFHLPVYLVDERLTTACAKMQSHDQAKIDSQAAKIILESWLFNNSLSDYSERS